MVTIDAVDKPTEGMTFLRDASIAIRVTCVAQYRGTRTLEVLDPNEKTVFIAPYRHSGEGQITVVELTNVGVEKSTSPCNSPVNSHRY